MKTHLDVLNLYRHALKTIDSLKRRYQALQERTTDITAHLSGMPRPPSVDPDRIGACLAQMDTVARDLEEHLRVLQKLYEDSERIVSELPTQTMQTFARDYWLSGFSIATAARTTPISVSYAQKLKKRIETYLLDHTERLAM